jgi:arsenate reductase (glutaredoxin)
MYKVYGIPNCDTVKKSLTWLTDHKIPFEFHNYKKDGITAERLKEWSKQVGWETILNKKSTTWKGLDTATQATATTVKNAVSLMKENTSLIKRPVIELNNQVVSVGFDAAKYEDKFGK